MIEVRLEEKYHWRFLAHGALHAQYVGREATVRDVLAALPQDRVPGVEEAGRVLSGIPGQFAAVVRGPGYALAAVDKARCYPLFHGRSARGLLLSNDARAVRDGLADQAVDPVALREFLMAGYVTGPHTVFRGVRQLQSGELLLWEEGGDAWSCHRYFRFHAREFLPDDPIALKQELGRAVDSIFRRLVDDLAGRPAWVPLSAGLDSRLVACKLHELGCPNLQTFSYGAPGNHEARHARTVARTLGLPWRFIPSRGAANRAFFQSDTRRAYWKFADGLCAIPSPQDIVELTALRELGALPRDAVLINGNSGDFISGGHIPRSLLEPGASLAGLLERFSVKHYSLWRTKRTPENLALVRAKLAGLAAEIDPEPATGEALAALWDSLEQQERQCKYVINGQRIYDFLGLDWRLPLWEDEFQFFWRQIPVSARLGQGLFKSWLDEWDYSGLFRGFKPVVDHWPGWRQVFFAGAQLAGILGGPSKDAFYSYARWFSHYGHQWQMYPVTRFLRHAGEARNTLALNVETWVQENLDPAVASFTLTPQRRGPA